MRFGLKGLGQNPESTLINSSLEKMRFSRSTPSELYRIAIKLVICELCVMEIRTPKTTRPSSAGGGSATAVPRTQNRQSKAKRMMQITNYWPFEQPLTR